MKKIGLFFFVASILPAGLKDDSIYHLYVWAQYNQFQENNIIAANCYQTILAHTKDKYVLPGFLSFLDQTEQYEKIIQLMPRLKQFDQHLEINLILAHALHQTGAPEQADQLLIQLAEKHPQQPEVIYNAVTALVRNKELSKATALLDSYLHNARQHPKNFIFHFLKAQLSGLAGNIEQTLEHLHKALEYNPSFDQAWLLLGVIQEQKGNIEQAIEAYTKTVQLSQNPSIQQHLLRLQMQKAYQTLQQQQQLYNQALAFFQEKNYQQALVSINKCLALGHKDIYILLKLELLYAQNAIPEMLDSIYTMLQQKPDAPGWYTILHTLYCKNNTYNQQIEALLKKIEQQSPNNPLPYLYQADIYLRTHQDDNAATYLANSLSRTQDPRLQAPVLLQLALLQYRHKKWPALENTIQQAEQLSVMQPALYNIAAYFYAHKPNQLAKAQSYIAKALEKEPNNIHFLDTQAYIWHKEHKNEQAAQLLRTIIGQHNDHYAFKHLSMIESKQGNAQEAKTLLLKAQQHVVDIRKKEKYQQQLALL